MIQLSTLTLSQTANKTYQRVTQIANKYFTLM